MRAANRFLRAIHAAYYYVPGLHRPTKPLLIVGHMRSGSTLLSHILSSHDQIVGYGETYRAYARPLDLKTLRGHLLVRQPRFRASAKWTCDKLVEDKSVLDPRLLQHSDVHLVLLLREPEGSLQSLRLFLADWSEQMVLNHYLTAHGRLQILARFASDSARVFCLTHHQLIYHTDDVLRSLTAFLELDAPLSERYETGARTGRNGDNSSLIKSGRVVRGDVKPVVPVSENSLSLAQQVHRNTLAFLNQRSTHADIPFG